MHSVTPHAETKVQGLGGRFRCVIASSSLLAHGVCACEQQHAGASDGGNFIWQHAGASVLPSASSRTLAHGVLARAGSCAVTHRKACCAYHASPVSTGRPRRLASSARGPSSGQRGRATERLICGQAGRGHKPCSCQITSSARDADPGPARQMSHSSGGRSRQAVQSRGRVG